MVEQAITDTRRLVAELDSFGGRFDVVIDNGGVLYTIEAVEAATDGRGRPVVTVVAGEERSV